MAEACEDFTSLMDRLRAGSPDAVRELHARYGGHVLRVIRRRFDRRLRPRFDSDDFAQAVWASFVALPAGRLDFLDEEELVGLLARMARHKVVDAYRRGVAADRRTVTRDCELLAGGVRGPQPTPSQFAVADEHWERMLAGQPPAARQALELIRQGFSHEEVAARLKVHLKAVQRLVRKLSERLDR